MPPSDRLTPTGEKEAIRRKREAFEARLVKHGMPPEKAERVARETARRYDQADGYRKK